MEYREYAQQHRGFMDDLDAAKWRGYKLLNRLGDYHNPRTKKEKERQRHLVRLALKDSDLKLHFTFKGIQGAKKLASYPPARVRRLATKMNLFQPRREAVRTRWEEKRGKWRQIVNFGPHARARQYLVAEVLKAIHDPHPYQFTLKGGVPAALGAVEKAIQEGYCFGKEVDITDYHPSIKRDGLYALLSPLPGPVVTHVVCQDRRVAIIAINSPPQDARALKPLPTRGLQGLPQGSACSNVAAEILMAEFLRAPPDGVRAIGYGDNVMVLGLTKQDVEQGTTAFAECLRTHACGPLVLKGRDSSVLDLREDQFEFLRHVGEYDLHDEDDLTVEWKPEHQKLVEIESEIESPTSTHTTLTDTIRRVEGWRRGYPRWSGREPWAAIRLAQLKAKLCCLVGGVERSLKAAEVVAHWRDLGFHVGIEQLLPDPSWPGCFEARNVILRRQALVTDRSDPTLLQGMSYAGGALLRRQGAQALEAA